MDRLPAFCVGRPGGGPGGLAATGGAILLLLASGAGSVSASGDESRVIESALTRSIAWLGGIGLGPAGPGVAGFRDFVVLAETWHRISVLDPDPDRRGRAGEKARSLLEMVPASGAQIAALLASPDGKSAYSDAAVLARRCAEHRVDPTAIRDALAAVRAPLAREIERLPPSLRLLHARTLPFAGIDPGLDPARLRAQGYLARRPREVDLTQADLYYLTHEIFALTDYALVPLDGLAVEESAYLRRVLPFYSLLYASLDNIDLLGELLACQKAAGLDSTWGYREGVRILLTRQRPDGAFGSPDPGGLGRPLDPTDYLHSTMNAVTVLLLELGSRGGIGR